MEFYTPFSTPDGYKKRLSRCPQGRCVGYKMMPSPKGSVRFAQLLMRIAGYAPAQRQGSALHPCWMPCTACRASNGHKAANGRAEVSCKSYGQCSRAGSTGAAQIFGCEFVGQSAATRVPPRCDAIPQLGAVQAAHMPASWHAVVSCKTRGTQKWGGCEGK